MSHSKAAAHLKLGGAVALLRDKRPCRGITGKHWDQNGCGGGQCSQGQGMPVLGGAAELSGLSGWEKKSLKDHCSLHLPKEGLWRGRC